MSFMAVDRFDYETLASVENYKVRFSTDYTRVIIGRYVVELIDPPVEMLKKGKAWEFHIVKTKCTRTAAIMDSKGKIHVLSTKKVK